MNTKQKYKYLICIVFLLISASSLKAEINNLTLAVLVNENDQESIEIAKYYQELRIIPDENIIYLHFKSGLNKLTEAEFNKVEKQLKEKVPDNIQAYALAWRKPWRVDCMSITSAFSLGFNKNYCAKGCVKTKPVKYFNSFSEQPYSDYGIRPSMMLSASSIEGVKKLIERGSQADYSRSNSSAYLLSTSDKNRNVRAVYYPKIKKMLNNVINIEIVTADAIKNKRDVMFYFTGFANVKWVNKNKYLPGAVADHLTSYGGYLFDNKKQMSVLKWIDAGVTGSYGTVVEPCAFVQKFPNPGIVIEKYLSGNTLLEAYWKSVQMPGQGVFVGEPLSSPFKNCTLMKNHEGFYQYSKNRVKNYVEKSSRNCN